MDEQIEQNLYAWRAFHYNEGHLTPIWYTCIDAHQRATAIIDKVEWMAAHDKVTPYRFDLHKWNCSDVTPAQDMDDQEWMGGARTSRVGLMRATQAGFHSFTHAADAVAYANHNKAWIVGKIQLAGRVIEHEYGYRSQFLRVTELYLENGRGTNNNSIGDSLGWPFELKSFSQAMIAGRGIIASFEQGFGDYA